MQNELPEWLSDAQRDQHEIRGHFWITMEELNQALIAARREGVEMAATVLTAQGSALWEKADLRQATERDDAFAAFIVDNCAAAIRQLGGEG